jgi:putative PIN family toxin of toxin-antitoxin system
MRVVADTNIVIAGLLWQVPPRQIFQAAHGGSLAQFTSAALLAELEDVLKRPQFAKRLHLAGVQAKELVRDYAALAQVVPPADIGPAIADDPDDDAVLACGTQRCSMTCKVTPVAQRRPP